MAVYLAALQHGDTILAWTFRTGISHGHPLNFSGRTSGDRLAFGARRNDDYEQMEHCRR
jgi:hypothetical protein